MMVIELKCKCREKIHQAEKAIFTSIFYELLYFLAIYPVFTIFTDVK